MVRRRHAAEAVAVVILGLTVLLSYNFGPNSPGFRMDALSSLAAGFGVAFIIVVAARHVTGTSRLCPTCRRVIPRDARMCPYCGRPFT